MVDGVGFVPWFLAIGFALIAAALVLPGSRWRAVLVIGLSLPFLGYSWRQAWLQPGAAIPWFSLVALVAVTVWRMADEDSRVLRRFLILTAVALVVRWLAPWLPANWYVDYHAVTPDAQPPVMHFTGGMAYWPAFLSQWVSVTPGFVFIVSAACSAVSAGMLAATLSRHCGDGPGKWPRYTYAVFGIVLCFDWVMVWLGASDAPHNIALLAFSLGFYWYAEMIRTADEPASPSSPIGTRLINNLAPLVILLCSALVGLTRPELLLWPLAYVFMVQRKKEGQRTTDWLRGHLLVLVPIVLGIALAFLTGSHGRILEAITVHRSAGGAGFLEGLFTQSPLCVWLRPFFSYAAPLLFLFYLWLCWRKKRLLLLLGGYFILVLPKVLGGFGGAVVGELDPSDRYNIISVPLVLLMFSAGLVHVAKTAWAWLKKRNWN